MNENNFFHKLGDFIGGNGWGRKARHKAYFNSSMYSNRLLKGEVYLNTQTPYEIVQSISEISIPMRRIASMYANGVFMLEDIKTEKRDLLPTDLERLFKKPNPIQSQNEWMKQSLMQLQAYGNNFIYVNKSGSTLTDIPASLVNLNPSTIKPILTGKFYKQVSIDGIIEKFLYTEGGREETIKVNEIVWNKVGDLNDSILGKSLISSLQFPLSNTELAYKYLNKISGASGMLGILSNKKKDSIGSAPLTDDEQKGFDDNITNNYGVEDNQRSIYVTSADVDFTFTSPETRRLLLLEQIDANFKTILNALGCNQNIFINSTYENLKHGLVSTHNDTIVPYADSFCQSLTDGLGNAIPVGKRLVLDYSHTPYLQSDQKENADIFSVVSNGLNGLVASQIITPQEAKIRLTNQFGDVKSS